MDTEAPAKHTPENPTPDDGIGWEQAQVVERTVTDHGVRRSGPGRKSRACESSTSAYVAITLTSLFLLPIGVECRKQKMKCEVFPGDKKCRNCLRRSTECIFRRIVMSEVTDDRVLSNVAPSYE